VAEAKVNPFFIRSLRRFRERRPLFKSRHLAGHAGFRIGDLASAEAGKMPTLQMLVVHADVPRAGKMPALQ
jgi:hypothetical protein